MRELLGKCRTYCRMREPAVSDFGAEGTNRSVLVGMSVDGL